MPLSFKLAIVLSPQSRTDFSCNQPTGNASAVQPAHRERERGALCSPGGRSLDDVYGVLELRRYLIAFAPPTIAPTIALDQRERRSHVLSP